MHRYLASVFLALCCMSQVQAQTWYSFARSFSDTALYFFDVDSVGRQGDTVTVWIKYVGDPISPDVDGSYATAQRFSFECGKHTLHALSTITYDKGGKPIRTHPDTGRAQNVAAGSIGDSLFKAACTADFPKNPSHELYFPVLGNDVFRYTESYFEHMRRSETDHSPN